MALVERHNELNNAFILKLFFLPAAFTSGGRAVAHVAPILRSHDSFSCVRCDLSARLMKSEIHKY